MPVNRDRAKQYLRSFDFRPLFVEELGWDKYTTSFPVSLGSSVFTLKGVAEKRAVVVFVCEEILDYATRLKIEKVVAKSHFEHFIIFGDKNEGAQVWQWARREPSRPLRVREHHYKISQSGELLIQKLENILVTLDQEEVFTLASVTHGLKAGFDIEAVTKKFFERFKAEHERFLKLMDGIPEEPMKAWYASVMINRLMFLYFVQAKAFLDGDIDYLRNKLTESKKRGKDLYYTDFLCTLFFDGFAKRKDDRPQVVKKLLGDVPYLNGGLFQKHQIEELHGKKIQIPDRAFDRLFEFFKEYQWHLDERPDKNDREINPDVLGYIFEKYINQKQMGAYYTKEDITEYISKSTIVPFLFNAAKKLCSVAFEPGGYVWRLLSDNPNRYIYEAIRRGSDHSVPADISSGIENVRHRDRWNLSTPYVAEPDSFLPTETWREFIGRRHWYKDVRLKLASGSVDRIDSFTTLNLDIRQFAEDVIQYSEGPELVRAFYKSISKVSILDPTCGSGAFLFAALNVLKPLYEACLKRMSVFVEEYDATAGKPTPEKFKDFREILTECRSHQNQDYFVLKAIIVNNLYGVDIMDEAVEICKLRLFLKLVAQVDTQDNIEPLPDIDFNIRSGNTLVGYVRYADVERAVTSKFDFGGAMAKIEDKAKILDSAVEMFRLQQTKLNGTVTSADKIELSKRFTELEDELNDFLAAEYGVKPKKGEVEKWKSRSRPFHWFSNFHRIMAVGGFDVVIGNPPYVEYQKVKGDYTLLDEFTPFLGNLYAACSYRAGSLLSEGGFLSFIVPVSLPSTDRMAALRDFISKRHSVYYVSFSTRPQKLFDGAEQRLTIYVQTPSTKAELYSGGFIKWNTQERPSLFQRLAFSKIPQLTLRNKIWPKLSGRIQSSIFEKIMRLPFSIGSLAQGPGESLYYKNTGLRYFNTVTLRPPKCWINGKATSSSRETILSVLPQWKAPVHAVLLSSLYFGWYQILSNCRDLNPSDISTFPIPKDLLGDRALADLSKKAERDYSSKAKILTMNNKLTGKVELESMSPAKSKQVIDEIDSLLATPYGLTDEELDYVINYDIKYRIGADESED